MPPLSALDPADSAPALDFRTEGIKYAGSKRKLIPDILNIVSRLPVRTALDACSGSTRVAQALARNGLRTTANDIAVWSQVFGQCYLLSAEDEEFYAPLLAYLNALPPEHGWFSEHYGGDGSQVCSDAGDGRKKLWQWQNTRKLDAIRSELDRLSLSEIQRSVLLTALILALDRVDSSVGHQVSYLKRWASRSYQTLSLRLPLLIPAAAQQGHRVLRSDLFDLLASESADLIYLDPPYGSGNERMPPSRVRYASYYHVWTTLCLNDRPSVQGRAARRADCSDPTSSSIFEEYHRNPESGRWIALEAMERALRSARCAYLLLSYSSQGRVSRDDLAGMISDLGYEFRVFEKSHRDHVMRSMQWTGQWSQIPSGRLSEYLILIGKAERLPRNWPG